MIVCMDKPIVPREIQKVFTGRIFSVTIETVDLPKGHRLEAEVVRHPPSVVIVPVTTAGEIVLVRQYRHPIGRWVWELPAGSVDAGEDLERAAIRECHEEIQMIPSRVDRLGAFFATPGYNDEEMNFYRATGLRVPGRNDEAAHQDEDEDIEARAFPREALQAMVAAGEIVDMKTVVGLWLDEMRQG
jgi:ADP-ribose pyrophosphatase